MSDDSYSLADQIEHRPPFPNWYLQTVPPQRAWGSVQTYQQFTHLFAALMARVVPDWVVAPRSDQQLTSTGPMPRVLHHLRMAQPVRTEPKARQRPPDRVVDEKGRVIQVLAQRAIYVVQFDCLGHTESESEHARDRLQLTLAHYTGWFKLMGVQQMFWDEFPVAVEPAAAEGPWVRSTRWQIVLEQLWFQPEYTIQKVGLDLYQMTELVENERVDRSGRLSLQDRFQRDRVWRVLVVGETPSKVQYLEGLHYLGRPDGLEWLVPDPPTEYYVTYTVFVQPDRTWLTDGPSSDRA